MLRGLHVVCFTPGCEVASLKWNLLRCCSAPVVVTVAEKVLRMYRVDLGSFTSALSMLAVRVLILRFPGVPVVCTLYDGAPAVPSFMYFTSTLCGSNCVYCTGMQLLLAFSELVFSQIELGNWHMPAALVSACLCPLLLWVGWM
jgi:hypothetical protein